MNLKELHLKTLEYLAKYKYGTLALMVKQGVNRNGTHISSSLSYLSSYGMTDKVQLTSSSMAYYYLTKKGAEWIQDNLNIQANYPKKEVTRPPQPHHMHVIEFWINIESKKVVLQSECYLNNQQVDEDNFVQRKTNIDGIEPDLTFLIETPTGPDLYMYEFENTKSANETWALIKKHIDLMGSGKVQEKYQLGEWGYRVLIEIDNQTRFNDIMKRAKEDTYLSKLAGNFQFWNGKEWLNALGQPTGLFQKNAVD